MMTIIKIATLVTISTMIMLSFLYRHSSPPPPPAEANIPSNLFSAIKQINLLHHDQFRYRKALQFKNIEENKICSSSTAFGSNLAMINRSIDSVCNPSLLHIAMTLDNHYIRGTVAAVHSILHNSLCPENMCFHFIYSDANPLLRSLVKDIFPSLKFKAYYYNLDIVKNKISSSEEPLNYARNYLVYLLEPCVEKVIYLDSDVILVDDISILWRINLTSATVGSPEYCHVNFNQFFTPNFWSQKKFSRVFSGRNRNPCYFNTGVMVIDLTKWIKFRHTEMMERWMEIQREQRIYNLGSLPPFLLVFAGDIAPINRRWNEVGFGADDLSGDCRQLPPSPFSLLHWNGKNKPWLRLDSGNPCPIDIIWSQYDLYVPAQQFTYA
ncbi:hypothetical protein ACH5RR_022888 [Cinchona calisaya]|uniref:Hexosyltransferase n=1 Tax=Cinchona calisaya TaxID=153742 RepID=A0ABD2Z931_9GENT